MRKPPSKVKEEVPAVMLTPAFLELAARFGMVPVGLAERVLASFVKDRPRQLTISASKRRVQ